MGFHGLPSTTGGGNTMIKNRTLRIFFSSRPPHGPKYLFFLFTHHLHKKKKDLLPVSVRIYIHIREIHILYLRAFDSSSSKGFPL